MRSGTAGRHSNGAVSYAAAGGWDVPSEESPCPASAVLYPHREQRPCMEYEYRHEGVNDYITAPVNIPELDPAGFVLCGVIEKFYGGDDVMGH